MDNNDSKPQQTGGMKLMTVFIAVLALHVLVIGGITVFHLMGSGGGDADLTLDKTHKLKADGTVVTDTTAPDAAAPDKSADGTASTDTATAAATPGASGTTTAASTSATDASSATTDTATPAAAPAPPPAPAQVAANPPAETAPATPATTAAASPIVLSGDDMSQTSTIPPGLAPPPDATPAPNVPDLSPAPAPDTSLVTTVHAPSSTAPVGTPAPEAISSSAPSGPVAPEGEVSSGPVHMPANPPAPADSSNVASHEEHASAPAHEEHSVASAHEAKKEFYTVKITDSYQKIAHSHHISVAELKAANHIRGNVLHTGQKLVIPQTKTSVAKSGASHDRQEGETASLSASPASSAKLRHHYYTVAKGDTLRKIARKFDVTASAIEDANNLDGTKLAVGERLRIPSHESRGTAGESTSSASLTDRVVVPAAAPAPIEPSQVETQPAPVEQPAPTPVAAPAPEPQPTPASSPELTSLNF